MENPHIYDDLKNTIKSRFSFLKEFEFPDFEECQLDNGWLFETNNKFSKIEITFEAAFSTPVFAKINGYDIDELEPQNAIVKQYNHRIIKTHDELLGLFLKTGEDGYQQKNTEYPINDQEVNNRYLLELSEMIKRHISVLHGDMELLKSNIEIRKQEQEQQAAAIRIKKQIYTLEYCFICDGQDGKYDSNEEFETLQDLKQYLAQRDHIKIYRILDWNMNPVS
ncbi:MAG: hypothetical protein JWR38_169 [Mucilaginibacter sp.]|nr:hypothetical protein [Mucilaginibacter sp.]